MTVSHSKTRKRNSNNVVDKIESAHLNAIVNFIRLLIIILKTISLKKNYDAARI